MSGSLPAARSVWKRSIADTSPEREIRLVDFRFSLITISVCETMFSGKR